MGEEVVTSQPPDSAQAGERRRAHPWFAKYYSRVSVAMDRAGMAAHRARLLEGLHGEVAEVGAGNGLNFRHYPGTVTRLVAVEPEPSMRMRAGRAARELPQGPAIEVVAGLAERLPLADASCDAVVASLVLCSVPDQQAALAEICRVLRPGGEFRFLEHVRSSGRLGALSQLALDATVWPRLGAGCHCARDSGAAVAAAGFRISALDRFRFPQAACLPQPTAPHVIGRATKAVQTKAV